MTDHVARVYALVAAVLVFFLVWAGVAAHPWRSTAAQDPRVTAVAARQLRLQQESLRVKRVLDRRWAAYRAALRERARAAAASTPAPPSSAPSVRVVTLPPLVVTRTS
jgi:hypothetical protein